MFDHIEQTADRKLLESLLHEFRSLVHVFRELSAELREIRDILSHKPRSATLVIRPDFNALRSFQMPVTLDVGKTATAVFKEWTGPNGTGDEVPLTNPPIFQSDNGAVATVDANGVVTAVSGGTATISGHDTGNGLSASDTVTVNAPPPPPTPVSATLTLTANP